MKQFLICIAVTICSVNLSFAQDKEVKIVKYSPDFKFKDGIYLSFNQVKVNNPLPASRIVSETPHDDPGFYDKLLTAKKISYFDDFGVQQSLTADNIWGFSRNGIIYIKIGNGFSRVTVVGGICHFVADITTYTNRYYDPGYYNPYSYNSYNNYNRYGYSPNSYATTEMKQYLIDFETGKIMEYNEKSLDFLLMKDPELHDEFVALKRKKQKQLKFLYIRKFNEKNPIYLPVNN
jgi:hypothetical protein